MSFSFLAMWNNKCPKCRQGSIFTEPFKLTDPLNMPHKCEHCGQLMEPEPGYYYGAMFMSYIVTSLIFLPFTLILVFLFDWSELQAFGLSFFILFISYFKILRGARSLWIHMMVRHDPNIEQEIIAKKEKAKSETWKPRLKGGSI